jgi:hypothetical protein
MSVHICVNVMKIYYSRPIHQLLALVFIHDMVVQGLRAKSVSNGIFHLLSLHTLYILNLKEYGIQVHT